MTAVLIGAGGFGLLGAVAFNEPDMGEVFVVFASICWGVAMAFMDSRL